MTEPFDDMQFRSTMGQLHLDEVVARNARWYPSNTAVVHRDSRWSWHELNQVVDQTAALLLARGLRHGEIVTYVGQNAADILFLLFAAARTGTIFAPVSNRIGVREIAPLLTELEPSLVIVDAEHLEVTREALKQDRPIDVLDGGADSWRAQVSRSPTAPVRRRLDDGEPFLILYTSGSTGVPKGAALTARGAYLNALNTGMTWGLRRGAEACIAATPMFHVSPLNLVTVMTVSAGKTVIIDRFRAENYLQAVEDEGVTILHGFHTTIKALLECDRLPRSDLSSIRRMVFGVYDPSQVIARMLDVFASRGHPLEVIHTYGCTEAGPMVTMLPPDLAKRKFGSIGKPYMGVEVSLRDDAGKEVPQGADGEIVVRSASLMHSYWRRPEETAAVQTPAGLRTGDMARSDEDGFLYFTGRKKDVIRTGGENVSAREVEAALLEHPAITDVAAVGVPDPEWEEAVAAVVVTRDLLEDDAPLTQEAVQAFAREHLARFKVPKVVLFVPVLPRNPLGKLRKAEIRELAAAATQAVAAGEST